jgi:hypothetical protein
MLDANLHWRSDAPGRDRVSAFAQSLAQQAQSLEQDIVSGRDAAPGQSRP